MNNKTLLGIAAILGVIAIYLIGKKQGWWNKKGAAKKEKSEIESIADLQAPVLSETPKSASVTGDGTIQAPPRENPYYFVASEVLSDYTYSLLLQRHLNRDFKAGLIEDGKIGALTLQAVKTYIPKKSLPVTISYLRKQG